MIRPRPSTRRILPGAVWRRVILALAGAMLVNVSRGEDRVTLLDSQEQVVTRTGEVVHYDQKELRLRLPQGTTHRVSADRVLEVLAERGAEHAQADEAFERGDDAAALTLYRAAFRAESRRWVQHQIVARSVSCLRHLDQSGSAATTFLALWQQDPETPWSHVIPLAWRSEQPDRILEEKAVGWLASRQPDAARLIAASWLLSGRQREAARRVLEELERQDADHWIGQLANAQLWRLRVVAVDQDEVKRWQAALAQMPTKHRAGPSFVIAQALARLGESDAAALAFLQVAWMQEEDRKLAAESLWAAAQLLHQAKHLDEAGRIYRELVARFPQSPLGVEAERILGRLNSSP